MSGVVEVRILDGPGAVPAAGEHADELEGELALTVASEGRKADGPSRSVRLIGVEPLGCEVPGLPMAWP